MNAIEPMRKLASQPIAAFKPSKVPLPKDARATKALLQYTPQLSLAERDRRWDQVRKYMRMSGLDALIFLGNDLYWGMGMANLRYMFQVDSAIGGDALFPLEGNPVIWNSVQHMNRPTSAYLSIRNGWVSFAIAAAQRLSRTRFVAAAWTAAALG